MRKPPRAVRVGCVAVAAMLGIIAAARPAGAVEPGEWGLVKLRFFPGDSVILTLKDSTRVAGEFQGLAKTSPEAYGPRYERWRSTAPQATHMPAMGAQVELVGFGMSNFARGSFWGFSQEAVEIQKKRDAPIGSVEFARFTHLVVPGKGQVRRQQLERWSKAGELPRVTELRLQTADGPRTIPLDDVAAAQAPGFAPAPRGLGLFSDRVVFVGASVLEVGVSQFYGLDGGDATVRFFPMVPGALGPDIALGVTKFDHGWLMAWDLDMAVTAPLGRHAGLEPRIGGGLLYGESWAAITGNIGVGVFALVAPNFGVRVDCGSRFGLVAAHVGLFMPHP